MTTDASSGGLAAGVRWNLSDLYASVDDPRIDADLDAALASAGAFAKEYRGHVGELSAADLANITHSLWVQHWRHTRLSKPDQRYRDYHLLHQDISFTLPAPYQHSKRATLAADQVHAETVHAHDHNRQSNH